MSRNFQDLNRIEKMVDNQDFRIHFFQDKRIFCKESSRTDRMYLGIETTINKHWSDKISYDVRMANKYKALKGVAPGRALFGYVYNKNKKQHEIDPIVEKDLRYIFDSFDSGDYSLEQFVRVINKAGITNRTGKKWTMCNMYSLLTKNFYCKEFLYQGEVYKGNHKPYFPKHRFEKRMQNWGAVLSVALKRNLPFFLLNS